MQLHHILKINSISPPTLFIVVVVVVLSLVGSLLFHINFSISLSISIKQTAELGFLYWNCLEPIHQFEENWHLQPHEQSLALLLFRSSFISISIVMYFLVYVYGLACLQPEKYFVFLMPFFKGNWIFKLH